MALGPGAKDFEIASLIEQQCPSKSVSNGQNGQNGVKWSKMVIFLPVSDDNYPPKKTGRQVAIAKSLIGALYKLRKNRIYWIRIPHPDSMWSRVTSKRHAHYIHFHCWTGSRTLSRSAVMKHSTHAARIRINVELRQNGLCIRIRS